MGQIRSRLQNLLPPKPATTGSEVVYYRHQDCNFNVKLFNTTELIAFDQKERCVSSRLFRLYFEVALCPYKCISKEEHRNCQLTTNNPGYQIGWAILVRCRQ